MCEAPYPLNPKNNPCPVCEGAQKKKKKKKKGGGGAGKKKKQGHNQGELERRKNDCNI